NAHAISVDEEKVRRLSSEDPKSSVVRIHPAPVDDKEREDKREDQIVKVHTWARLPQAPSAGLSGAASKPPSAATQQQAAPDSSKPGAAKKKSPNKPAPPPFPRNGAAPPSHNSGAAPHSSDGDVLKAFPPGSEEARAKARKEDDDLGHKNDD